MTVSEQSGTLSPELTRLQEAVDLLERLREVFYEMDDDGERERGWAYLSDRFAEFEKADVPGWENLPYDLDATCRS